MLLQFSIFKAFRSIEAIQQKIMKIVELRTSNLVHDLNMSKTIFEILSSLHIKIKAISFPKILYLTYNIIIASSYVR